MITFGGPVRLKQNQFFLTEMPWTLMTMALFHFLGLPQVAPLFHLPVRGEETWKFGFHKRCMEHFVWFSSQCSTGIKKYWRHFTWRCWYSERVSPMFTEHWKRYRRIDPPKLRSFIPRLTERVRILRWFFLYSKFHSSNFSLSQIKYGKSCARIMNINDGESFCSFEGLKMLT